MKVCITGHTSGIGKSFDTYFMERGDEVRGFSRANGYDIRTDITKILDESEDAGIFINNAYCFTQRTNYQLELFYKLYERWKDSDKIIVNIGSSIIHHKEDMAVNHQVYQTNKRALYEASMKLSSAYPACKILHIAPGVTDTNLTKGMTQPKVPPEVLVDFFDLYLQNRDYIRLTNVVINAITDNEE